MASTLAEIETAVARLGERLATETEQWRARSSVSDAAVTTAEEEANTAERSARVMGQRCDALVTEMRERYRKTNETGVNPIARDVTAANAALTQIHQRLPSLMRTFGGGLLDLMSHRDHIGSAMSVMQNRYKAELSSIENRLETIEHRLGKGEKQGQNGREGQVRADATSRHNISLAESLRSQILRDALALQNHLKASLEDRLTRPVMEVVTENVQAATIDANERVDQVRLIVVSRMRSASGI